MKDYTKINLQIFENDGEDLHILELKILFDYTPEDPGVHTYPNGDPGYPGSPAEIDIYSITCENDLFDESKISDDTREELESKCLSDHENRN